MPNRAADDFTTIREHLERIKKEQDEALKNVGTEPKTDEEIHQEVYGEYCNGNTACALPVELTNAINTANAAVGNYYYDEVMLDEEDNEIKYHKLGCIYDGVKLPNGVYTGCICDKPYLPNRVLP